MMTARERIIVGMTSMAVVWAGVIYVRDWRPARDADACKAENDVSKAQAFATQSRARLAAVQVTAAEQAGLVAAQGEWDGQPFAEGAPPVTVEAPEAAPPSYIYSGYVQAGRRRFAIVNGKEYGVNEALADKTGVVQAIEPDHVVLRVGPDDRQQVVPLIERLKPGEEK